jgi:hypothetical protein
VERRQSIFDDRLRLILDKAQMDAPRTSRSPLPGALLEINWIFFTSQL